ncbi:amino acid ABC transporter permease [Azohydromonas australica]|uniref:amino acid ABC transporter permease n=1 Tax=Azohydromonas australica TaxID=364039 RepID=UPI0003F7D8FB|nr:ABC transporter permease subunit [Azohydromonas australica]
MKATSRARLAQALVLIALALLLAWLARNTLANMAARGIQAGWDFIGDAAGFDIGEAPIAFDAGQSYGRAFLVGVLNTLRVALAGIATASLLGGAIGLARLSRNALLSRLAGLYVELFRNVPLLVQLLLWYLLLVEYLPDPGEPLQLGSWFLLSKGGLSLPWPGEGGWSLPQPGPFAVEGGATLTPEFVALWGGLSLYTAAFIAEVVRGGMLAVPRGQTEAALSIGLSRAQVLRRVVLPQALRVIVPPLANQYLNLTKNSSLAVAIGYPDVVSIANTTLNQTGRALECISLIMAVYLCTSLLTAALMHALDRRAAIRER